VPLLQEKPLVEVFNTTLQVESKTGQFEIRKSQASLDAKFKIKESFYLSPAIHVKCQPWLYDR